jgi:hypothetical protein
MTGVRHLVWDIGFGFKVRQINISGWIAINMAFALWGYIWFEILTNN